MTFKEALKDFGLGVKRIFAGKPNPDNVFNIDGRAPLLKAIPFGLQHIFAMFAANVTPYLLVFAALAGMEGVQALETQAMVGALFMAGIGTLIQLFFGARLPIVVGTSFTYVPIFITVCLQVVGNGGTASDAFYTILGSSIVGGAFTVVFAFLYKYWSKLIKPIVPAIVVLAIGLSLFHSGAADFFGGTSILSATNADGIVVLANSQIPLWVYILVSTFVLIVAITWQVLARGVYKNLNIIVAILAGYGLSCLLNIWFPGFVDFSRMNVTGFFGTSGVVAVPRLIDFTKLRFELVPIIMTTCAFIASSFEAIGDSSALAEMGCGRKATLREIEGCLVADGFNSALGALFGSFPQTTYSENVGLVAQTKIVNRFTIFCGAMFMVIASFFPPVANIIYTIPSSVIGGVMIILFGSIAAIGMKMVGEVGWTKKNILIVSVSATLGFGMSILTELTGALNAVGLEYLGGLLSNCVITMFAIAMIMSWALPEDMDVKWGKKKEAKENEVVEVEEAKEEKKELPYDEIDIKEAEMSSEANPLDEVI